VKKQNQILYLLTLTFFVVVAWIVFSVYHNIVTSTISPTIGREITPIPPDFNTHLIGTLKNRQGVIPLYNFVATQSSSHISTSSAQITPAIPTPVLSPQITPLENASSESQLNSNNSSL